MIAATLAISHRLDGRIVRGCPRLALARAFMRDKTATIRLALQAADTLVRDGNEPELRLSPYIKRQRIQPLPLC